MKWNIAMRIIPIAAVAATLMVAGMVPANASIVWSTGSDKDCKGNDCNLFLDKPNTNKISDFGGHVGDQDSGPFVDIHTVGAVDTGNGWANFKPFEEKK